MSTDAIVLPAAVGVPPAAVLTGLLHRIAEGDRTSFAHLYDALSARVFGLVLRILVNRALAEETVQDVFLEVWQKAASFDGARGAAHTWVLTIAHHRAVDRVRAQQNATDRDLTAGMRELEPDRDVVADQVGDRAEAHRLLAALTTLTESQRRTLSLAYFDGYSQSEIAALTDTPLGTVKSTTRAALLRLRKTLGDPQADALTIRRL